MKGHGYCISRIVASVGAVLSIATCFAQPVLAVREGELHLAEGSPPANVVIKDWYRMPEVGGTLSTETYEGRSVRIYDLDERVVNSHRMNQWGVPYKDIVTKYNADGERYVRFFCINDVRESKPRIMGLYTTLFDTQDRESATLSCRYDQETEDFSISRLMEWSYDDEAGTYLQLEKYGEGIIQTETEGKLSAEGVTIETKTTKYGDDGTVEEIRIEQFDTKGNLIKSATTDAEGNLVSESFCEYDEQGERTKTMQTLYETTYREGMHTRVYTFEYADEGSRTLRSDDGAEPFLYRLVKYNEYGEVVAAMHTEKADKDPFWDEYIYENRDEFGNWTKRTRNLRYKTIDGNVVQSDVTLRTIIYYPELADAAVANPTEIEGEEG